MAARFTEEEKNALKVRMMELGFRLLKAEGIQGVNIDAITRQCYVSKGTFFNLFGNKTAFLHQVMLYKRQQSRDRIQCYLGADGKLSKAGLNCYLHWLTDENPNIFSYLDGQHTRWLISKWPQEYLQNEENDEQTARHIISLLADPREDPDWKLFCNYLKLISMTLNNSDYLIGDAIPPLLDNLIREACSCISS